MSFAGESSGGVFSAIHSKSYTSVVSAQEADALLDVLVGTAQQRKHTTERESRVRRRPRHSLPALNRSDIRAAELESTPQVSGCMQA
jgi:hypothetical protein